MKKILILCVILAMLFSMTGCRQETPAAEDTVDFYYIRNSYVYGAEDGVIAAEARDTSNRANTLQHLLTLYLQGPLDSELRSPFPRDCTMLGVTRDGNTLCVTMDSAFAQLEAIDLTLACACMAKTCFSLSDATQVQIQAEDINVVISNDNLLLDDNSGLPQYSITEESQ